MRPSADRMWKRDCDDGWSRRQLRNVRERKTEKCGSVSLTLLYPNANTYPIPSTPDRCTWPRLSFGPNWMNGNSDLGSGTIQWGSHIGSTTRPILAETLWEAKNAARKPRGEGKRKTQRLKHYNRWKTFWLWKQGRKRGGRHWVIFATPVKHKSPWKTQCLILWTWQWYTQLLN